MSVKIITKNIAPGTIHISTHKSLYKPELVEQGEYSFQEMVKMLTTFTQTDNKNDVPMYSGSVYGETIYRADVNVIAMSAIIIDYDNEAKDAQGKGKKTCSVNPTLPEHIVEPLAGISYFYHSTHSNTTNWPKWRLLIPLDRFASRQVWQHVIDGILSMLGGANSNIDMSCFEVSRAFFVPSYPQHAANAAFAGYSNGQEVSPCSLT